MTIEQLYILFLETSGISTDTRKIENNSLFIALKGDNFDGNKFAKEAILQGAKYAIVDNIDNANGSSIFFVEDTLLTLQKLANHHRKQFLIPLIGITGSNGKTTSKELIACVLSSHFNVHFTEGNLNNHIGVPLTLLKLNKSHEIAIIEMGANKPGDITELCEIAQPTEGIITNIGKAHLEGFGNLEGVLRTKKGLYRSLQPISGRIVYNIDDELISANIPSETVNFSFGTKEEAFIQGKLLELNPFAKLSYSTHNYQSPALQTKMVGKYNFSNFLAAITYGVLFKVPFEKINKAICEYSPNNNRSQITKTEKNTLILDAYNANPSSMKNAIESFIEITTDLPKLMIIGDMLEMGNAAIEEHQKVYQQCLESNIETMLVGCHFSDLKDQTLPIFENCELARLYIQQKKYQNTMILLKGSRGIGLEKLVSNF